MFKPSFFSVCTVYVCIYLFGVIVPTCQITCFQKVEPAVKQKKEKEALCGFCVRCEHMYGQRCGLGLVCTVAYICFYFFYVAGASVGAQSS